MDFNSILSGISGGLLVIITQVTTLAYECWKNRFKKHVLKTCYEFYKKGILAIPIKNFTDNLKNNDALNQLHKEKEIIIIDSLWLNHTKEPWKLQKQKPYIDPSQYPNKTAAQKIKNTNNRGIRYDNIEFYVLLNNHESHLLIQDAERIFKIAWRLLPNRGVSEQEVEAISHEISQNAQKRRKSYNIPSSI